MFYKANSNLLISHIKQNYIETIEYIAGSIRINIFSYDLVKVFSQFVWVRGTEEL